MNHKINPTSMKHETIGGHGTAEGDFDTHGVDFEEPNKWVDFEGHLGRQKVDGCWPWGGEQAQRAPRRTAVRSSGVSSLRKWSLGHASCARS